MFLLSCNPLCGSGGIHGKLLSHSPCQLVHSESSPGGLVGRNHRVKAVSGDLDGAIGCTHHRDTNWVQLLQVKGTVLLFGDVVTAMSGLQVMSNQATSFDLPVVVEVVGIELEVAMLIDAPSFGKITTTNVIDCKSLTKEL